MRRSGAWWAAVVLVGAAWQVGAQTNQAIYTDSLQNGWQDWGWATISYNNTSPVHSGAKSISVTLAGNSYPAIYIHHAPFDTTYFTNLTFWVHGGASGGQRLNVQALLDNSAQPAVELPPLSANTWQPVTLPLASLGVAGQPNFSGFWIQDRLGTPQPTFYLDDITLIGGNPPPPVTNAPVAITVNALLNRHPISPWIYGVAFAASNQLAELNSPLNRSGGNSETRYHWQLNAHNRGNDWYFESIADSPATAGAAADDHVANSKAAGAEAVLTVPMIGWVPKLGPSRGKLASYSIAKYGPQTGNDWQWFADAGNGISATNNRLITWNDPLDANSPIDSAFQQGWIRHLTNRWGLSTNGGVRYYCLDNEVSLWHSTHRDVHPIGATLGEIRDKFFDYAATVKAVDPSALVLAPEEWGWMGYLYSGYDQQWAGAQGNYNPALFPDRSTNGGWDYLPWFLDQARQRATAPSQRLLDVLTVHYYPQGGEFGDDVSTAMQLRRNQSTRSLWDPDYVDPTWISAVVKLIPRLRAWVAAYYPGTKIGITEYNWGAENHINGATAQADILGIFGREGLDYATRWTTPASTTPAYKAIQMFRNYDGHKSTFGDESVSASGPNPDNIATFAAVRSSDGALTLMVISKQLAQLTPVEATITNFPARGAAQVWQLTSANTLSRLGDVPLAGNSFSSMLPAQSVTLFVIPGATAPRLRASGMSPSGMFEFWLDGQAGQRYVVESSSNLTTWSAVQTNTLANASLHLALPVARAASFYRAFWAP